MKKDNNTIFENILLIEKGIKNIDTKSPNNIDLQDLLNKTNELKRNFKGIRNLLLILFSLIIVLIIILILQFDFENKVNDFNNGLEGLKEDSLIVKILDIKNNDSTYSFNYYENKGNIVSYNNLKKENDSIYKIITNQKNKNERILNLAQKVIKNSNKINEYNNKLLDENNNLKIKLNLVTENYPINFIETNNSIRIESKKIDSSLILLKHFRNRMTFNSKDNVWTIKK